jgi:hypothetical protein
MATSPGQPTPDAGAQLMKELDDRDAFIAREEKKAAEDRGFCPHGLLPAF